jgi:hypothetical protein
VTNEWAYVACHVPWSVIVRGLSDEIEFEVMVIYCDIVMLNLNLYGVASPLSPTG